MNPATRRRLIAWIGAAAVGAGMWAALGLAANYLIGALQ